MKLLLLFVFAGLFVLTACTMTPRYSSSPDPSWKPRKDYCWQFNVDPYGRDNTVNGWTDTEPALEPAGLVLTTVNVRYHTGGRSRSSKGGENEDYFGKKEVFAAGNSGLVEINQICH